RVGDGSFFHGAKWRATIWYIRGVSPATLMDTSLSPTLVCSLRSNIWRTSLFSSLTSPVAASLPLMATVKGTLPLKGEPPMPATKALRLRIVAWVLPQAPLASLALIRYISALLALLVNWPLRIIAIAVRAVVSTVRLSPRE